MATPATSHVDPLFIPVFGESIELLRTVLLTKSAQPFVVSGSGTLGWDMMVNLIEKGDNALVCNTGYFGDRFGECLQVYGANVTHLKASIGDRPTLQEIEKALRTDNYKMITITHVDTSTGVLSDIKAIAELTRRVSPNTLVVVDGVCSVGSEEIRFDEWDLDVVITGSQKGLGVPPGLSIVIASQRALQVFQDRKSPIASYFSSWQRWLPGMIEIDGKNSRFDGQDTELIHSFAKLNSHAGL
jgi:alanine-glyoxylate transaminase/serine-glyoxylate transaminase/serine-pyruvate transaminase